MSLQSRINNCIVRDKVRIAKVPSNYQSLLAICSDLDETPSLEVYLEIMKFLNTDLETSMGQGVALEIANSIYFDMPDDQFSYWNTDDYGRKIVRQLIEAGYIDTLHSFGDYAYSRSTIVKDLEQISGLRKKIPVWVDHAQAKSNIGSDIMLGEGDLKSSAAYHTDLTIDYGIKYFWLGRVTSIIGQNTKRSFTHLLNPYSLKGSFTTIFKEATKILLGKLKHHKYDLHSDNELLRDRVLRDGKKVVEFIRTNPHWGGVSCGDDSIGIADVLTDKILDRLVNSHGVSIIYTHLGKIRNSNIPFNEKTVNAFRLLKRYEQENKILVTTTSRLLAYVDMLRNVKIECDHASGQSVNILWQGDFEDLNGLTFYLKNNKNPTISLNGNELSDKVYQYSTDGLFTTISMNWPKLAYPNIA